jgi:hypothetical protein
MVEPIRSFELTVCYPPPVRERATSGHLTSASSTRIWYASVHALHRAADHINDGGEMSLGIETGGRQVMIAQSDRGIEREAVHWAILTQPR